MSIGSAAAAAGCSKVTIWRYMKDDKPFKGYHYRYPCKDTPPAEVWRVCRDAPRYEVSNWGRVRNRSTRKQVRECVIQGLHAVSLGTTDKAKTSLAVGRLVATEFFSLP